MLERGAALVVLWLFLLWMYRRESSSGSNLRVQAAEDALASWAGAMAPIRPLSLAAARRLRTRAARGGKAAGRGGRGRRRNTKGRKGSRGERAGAGTRTMPE